MAVLVQATIEHPFPITVRVPVRTAARFLEQIGDHLDRLGLLQGEHWSLDAEVADPNVVLRFALASQAFADQLQALIDGKPDEPITPEMNGEQVGFGIRGPASARFLDVFRIPRNTEMQPLGSQERTKS